MIGLEIKPVKMNSMSDCHLVIVENYREIQETCQIFNCQNRSYSIPQKISVIKLLYCTVLYIVLQLTPVILKYEYNILVITHVLSFALDLGDN